MVSACPLWSEHVKSTSQVTLNIFKVFHQPGFVFFFLSDELFLGSSGICCVFHLLHYFHYWGLHDEVSIFSATVWGRCHSDLLLYIFYNYLFLFFYPCHSALSEIKQEIIKTGFQKNYELFLLSIRLKFVLFLCLRSRAKTWINAVLTHIHQTVV